MRELLPRENPGAPIPASSPLSGVFLNHLTVPKSHSHTHLTMTPSRDQLSPTLPPPPDCCCDWVLLMWVWLWLHQNPFSPISSSTPYHHQCKNILQFKPLALSFFWVKWTKSQEECGKYCFLAYPFFLTCHHLFENTFQELNSLALDFFERAERARRNPEGCEDFFSMVALYSIYDLSLLSLVICSPISSLWIGLSMNWWPNHHE